MWIITDYAMKKILKGDFDLIIKSLQSGENLSIIELYKLQSEYESYNGFRKFFNKKLKPLSKEIRHIENKFLSKIIRFIGR